MGVKEIIKRLIGPRLTRRIQQARMPRFDGAHAKEWWRSRDQADPSLLDFYWQSRSAPARQAIAAAVAGLDGHSLLEIGCHVGPNLSAIAQVRPDLQLAGTDLSPTVLAEAKLRLAEASLTPDLTLAAADALPYPDNSFDICLTSVTLVCVGPEAIDASLNEIIRVTRRWLVLCEPWSEAEADEPDFHRNATYWIRNYSARLVGRADLVDVRHLALQHRFGHLDSIAIFKVTQRP